MNKDNHHSLQILFIQFSCSYQISATSQENFGSFKRRKKTAFSLTVPGNNGEEIGMAGGEVEGNQLSKNQLYRVFFKQSIRIEHQEKVLIKIIKKEYYKLDKQCASYIDLGHSIYKVDPSFNTSIRVPSIIILLTPETLSQENYFNIINSLLIHYSQQIGQDLWRFYYIFNAVTYIFLSPSRQKLYKQLLRLNKTNIQYILTSITQQNMFKNPIQDRVNSTHS